jgi:hypothetical protein
MWVSKRWPLGVLPATSPYCPCSTITMTKLARYSRRAEGIGFMRLGLGPPV